MTEMDKVAIQKKKLRGICEENDLVYELECMKYPIRLTIRPAKNMDAQLSMIEDAEEKGFTSPNAELILEMRDGDLQYKTSEKLAISDALFGKIKNIFKKIAIFYTQAAHRMVAEYKLSALPKIPEDDEEMSAEEMADEAEQELEDVGDDLDELYE